MAFKAGSSGDKKISTGASNVKHQPSHNALGKGTVYHQNWEGEDPLEFVDDGNGVLDVSCPSAAGGLDGPIAYAVVVTLEVDRDVAVPVSMSVFASGCERSSACEHDELGFPKLRAALAPKHKSIHLEACLVKGRGWSDSWGHFFNSWRNDLKPVKLLPRSCDFD
ncbi:MAG: hypothetical protein OXC93_13685 [Rhodospirillaceae bacterium]|nr:hypothetical protein [Rhodospirillaceae bacterium]